MPGRQRTKAREVIALLRDFGRLADHFDRLVPRWVDEKRASRFRYADLWREVRAAMLLNGLRLTTLAECLGEDVGMGRAEIRSDEFERFYRSFADRFDFEALGELDLLNLPDPYQDDGDVKGNDHAIWRRLLLVPFTQKFWNPDGGETGPDVLRQDKNLGEKLKAEREGILAWMVRGCLDWQRRGLCPPPEVMAATNEYRSREDRVQAFIDDCCLVSPMCNIKAGDLYVAYSKWCLSMGEAVETGQWFGKAVSERFEKTRSNGIRYRGIGLRADMNIDEQP